MKADDTPDRLGCAAVRGARPDVRDHGVSSRVAPPRFATACSPRPSSRRASSHRSVRWSRRGTLRFRRRRMSRRYQDRPQRSVTAVASHDAAVRGSDNRSRSLVVVWLIGLVFNLSRIAVSLVGLGLRRGCALNPSKRTAGEWLSRRSRPGSRLPGPCGCSNRAIVTTSRRGDIRRPCVVVPARASAWSNAWIAVPALPRARTRSARRLVRQSS